MSPLVKVLLQERTRTAMAKLHKVETFLMNIAPGCAESPEQIEHERLAAVVRIRAVQADIDQLRRTFIDGGD
jgi:hypothetical protein